MSGNVAAVARQLTRPSQESVVGLTSNSPSMDEIKRTLERLKKYSNTGIMLCGPTGAGKDHLAKTIHDQSQRKDGPFIDVNCAAIPDNLFESEFFGHEKGAFTGADNSKAGKFEQANGGTLFLNEIGEVPLGLQHKLLSAIEKAKVTRLGGSKEIMVNVRIIAATNRDLAQAVSEGKFREDLRYRLQIMTIELPPLRMRPEDIEMLSQFFVRQQSEKNNEYPVPQITPEAVGCLMNYSWPGNIRQLQHAIEQAFITRKETDFISAGDFSSEIRNASASAVQPKLVESNAEGPQRPLTPSEAVAAAIEEIFAPSRDMTMETAEKIAMCRALAAMNGDKALAAEALNIGRTTLYRKLHYWGWTDKNNKMLPSSPAGIAITAANVASASAHSAAKAAQLG